MKRVLVTGGAGFLGSHLCQRLLAQDCEVFCLDNLMTGSLDNIQELIVHPHFHFIEQDICLPLNLCVEEIYNLACPASPIHYQKDPMQTTKTSVLGALSVLELAKKSSCKILQASTSEVYGDPEIHPQKETYWGHVNPIGIRACYDEGKRCAETLFFDAHRMYGIPIKVVRIFNTYGPKMHPEDGRVVSNFIMRALKQEPLAIYGQGSQTRSFCFVDDLIDGLVAMMESPDQVIGPINLGNSDEFSIEELAKEVLYLTSSPSSIEYHSLPLDDPQKRQPDLSLAKKLLCWEPKIPLREGLQKTIAYFQQIIRDRVCR